MPGCAIAHAPAGALSPTIGAGLSTNFRCRQGLCVRRTDTYYEGRSVPLLQVIGLSKEYGRRQVVKELDFEVNRGEVVGLLGPNGAGKTTALKMVVGLVRPNSGQIILDDRNVDKLSARKRLHLGMEYIAHESTVIRCYSVEDNLMIELKSRSALSTRDAGRRREPVNLTAFAPFEVAGNSDELICPPFEIDPPSQSVFWHGEVESFQFGLKAPASLPPSNVIVSVTAGINGIPVGQIKFALSVSHSVGGLLSRELHARGDVSHRFDTVFISYSREDLTEVVKRTQALRSVGIKFFQDALTLQAGDHWAHEIYRHIDESDLFLLFWSARAQKSEWVMKEVRYALKRQGSDRFAPPEIIPVILEGPPVPKPPEDLAHLHFDDNWLPLIVDQA